MWDTMWHSMMSPEISIAEKMLRPLVVYAFLLIGLRLAGKRELAQLNSMDLIVLLTLSNTVQNAIIGPDNSLSGGLIGASTLLVINAFTVRFLYRHEGIDRLVEGQPTVLIERGKLREDHLHSELLTQQELEIAAHKQGFGSLEEIDKAVLEPGGTVTFVARQPTVDDARHGALTSRLEAISKQLEGLSAAVAARG